MFVRTGAGMIATGLQRADTVVLVGYFAIMLGIGAYFYRYMRVMRDYFSGGNRIPWWLSGVSYYMSCFSVFAFIAYSALAYQYGLVGVTVFWVMTPATLVSTLFFAKRWRRARIDSPVEYLETRYGPGLRQLFAWEGVPVRIIDDALKFVAIGVFVSTGLGLEMRPAMLWSGVVMLAYTFMGGLWAVAVTDFVQFIVMTAAVVVVLPLSVAEAGGIGSLLANQPAGFFRLTHPEYNWVYIGSNVFLFCLAFTSINWALIQRFYCVPTERDAYKVGGLVVVLNLIGPPLILLPAMAARHFLTGVEDAGQVYPLLCLRLLPAGMLGLVVAAMFSATMSMLSSDFNVCAGVLTNDVYRRLIRPGAAQGELVVVGRLMTLLVGVIALGVAFVMAGVGGEGLFRTMVKLFSIATAPVAVPMIAGLLSRRVTNAAALAGFVAGLGAGLAVFFACPDAFEVENMIVKKENVIVFATAAATLVCMLVVTAIGRRDAAAQRRVDAFLDRLDVPIGAAAEDVVPVEAGRGAISPFGVVGWSCAAIGGLMCAVAPAVGGGMAMVLDLVIGVGLMFSGVVIAVVHRARRVATATEDDR